MCFLFFFLLHLFFVFLLKLRVRLLHRGRSSHCICNSCTYLFTYLRRQVNLSAFAMLLYMFSLTLFHFSPLLRLYYSLFDQVHIASSFFARSLAMHRLSCFSFSLLLSLPMLTSLRQGKRKKCKITLPFGFVISCHQKWSKWLAATSSLEFTCSQMSLESQCKFTFSLRVHRVCRVRRKKIQRAGREEKRETKRRRREEKRQNLPSSHLLMLLVLRWIRGAHSLMHRDTVHSLAQEDLCTEVVPCNSSQGTLWTTH